MEPESALYELSSLRSKNFDMNIFTHKVVQDGISDLDTQEAYGAERSTIFRVGARYEFWWSNYTSTSSGRRILDFNLKDPDGP